MYSRINLNPFDFLFSLVLSSLLFLSPVASAHNKVVVIPLDGDSKSPAPFKPLTKHGPSTSDYTIGNITVIDKVTGLRWQKQEGNLQRDWHAAWAYCHQLSLAFFTDWRLPSIQELQSIVRYGNIDPSINTTAFPNTHASDYWSATTMAQDSLRAWSVNFFFGDINTPMNKNDFTRYVRCVR